MGGCVVVGGVMSKSLPSGVLMIEWAANWKYGVGMNGFRDRSKTTRPRTGKRAGGRWFFPGSAGGRCYPASQSFWKHSTVEPIALAPLSVPYLLVTASAKTSAASASHPPRLPSLTEKFSLHTRQSS
jgi:hypothetical protein